MSLTPEAHDAIHAALRECLGWCGRFLPATLPDQTPFRRSISRWYHSSEGWAALLDQTNSIAALVRSAHIADSALRFMHHDHRHSYDPLAQEIEDWPDAPPESPAAFARFLETRRKQLMRYRAAPVSVEVAAAEMARPRSLLLVDWEDSLTGGEACHDSLGFLDVYDAPGWDTWLALVDHPDGQDRPCLVSWVPPWAGAFVDEANVIDMAACHSWLRPTDSCLSLVGWGLRWDGSEWSR